MAGIRRAPRIAGLAVVLSLLLLTLLPTALADMNRPTWTVGDFWSYSARGLPFFGASFPGSPPTGTLRIEVTGTDSVIVGGRTYPTYVTSTRFVLTYRSGGITVTLTINGEAWYRTTDLGLVKQTLALPDSFSIIAIYDPPRKMDWPLRVNAAWVVTSFVTTTVTTTFGSSSDTTIEVLTVTVLDETSTTVPAGTFTTSPVRSSAAGAGVELGFWSPAVGNVVRSHSFNNQSQEFLSTDLVEYRYQAGGFGGLVLLLVLVLAVMLLVLGLVLHRRKRAAMAPYRPPGSGPWPPGAQPSQPPESPPPGEGPPQQPPP